MSATTNGAGSATTTGPVLRVVIPTDLVALVADDLSRAGFPAAFPPVDDPVVELPESVLCAAAARLWARAEEWAERVGGGWGPGESPEGRAASALRRPFSREEDGGDRTPYSTAAPELLTPEQELEDALTRERLHLIRDAIEDAIVPLDDGIARPGGADAALAVIEHRAGMLRALLPALREHESRSVAYKEARRRVCEEFAEQRAERERAEAEAA